MRKNPGGVNELQPTSHIEVVEKTGDVIEFIRKAREARTTLEPITASDFAQKIQETKGFSSKEEAFDHIQQMRDEWS